jgi:hypothetical protein
MSTMKQEALLALAAKGEVEQNLASLTRCPPSRHAAFAAIMAALVATPALPLRLRFVALALILTSILLVAQWDRRRLGVFINGYRRGKTRWVAFPLLVLILGLYLTSLHFAIFHNGSGICLALAAVTFVIGYIGSTLWQRVFVSELHAG